MYGYNSSISFSVVQEHHDITYDPQISTLEDDANVHNAVKDRKFIVFESQLVSLFHSCGRSSWRLPL